MAAPLVVSFWMRALFTFVDTIYAATLGDEAVAAIGLSIPFEFLMIAVWVGLSTGLTSQLARAMGAGQAEKVEQYLAAAWRMVLAVVPIFAAIGGACWLLAPRLSPSAETARQFAIYGAVLIGGSAFSTFWSVIPDSVVKAHGDTRSTMWAGVWSNVINVGLNTLFTFVLHWGIFGIAASTVIGRFGGLVYALRRASAHQRAWKASDRAWTAGLDPAPYRAILALATPAALAYCLMASETGIVNALLAGLPHGTESIAAYAIHYRVLQFLLMPAIATAVAMLPFTARRFGENDIGGIREGLRQTHVAGLVYVALTAPILFFAAGPLAAWLTTSPIGGELATFAIRIIPLACLASMPMFLCRPVFEGLGQGRPGLVMALLRYVVLVAPAAWLGIVVARALELPELYGMIGGQLGTTILTSSMFLVWTHLLLRRAGQPVAEIAGGPAAGGSASSRA